MATKCAHCRSLNTVHEVNEILCYDCGQKTNYKGQALRPNKKKK